MDFPDSVFEKERGQGIYEREKIRRRKKEATRNSRVLQGNLFLSTFKNRTPQYVLKKKRGLFSNKPKRER